MQTSGGVRRERATPRPSRPSGRALEGRETLRSRGASGHDRQRGPSSSWARFPSCACSGRDAHPTFAVRREEDHRPHSRRTHRRRRARHTTTLAGRRRATAPGTAGRRRAITGTCGTFAPGPRHVDRQRTATQHALAQLGNRFPSRRAIAQGDEAKAPTTPIRIDREVQFQDRPTPASRKISCSSSSRQSLGRLARKSVFSRSSACRSPLAPESAGPRGGGRLG